MTEDFATNNSLNFNGTFKTKNSVLKLNTTINSGLKDQFSKGVWYDASLETKLFGLDTKINLKAPHFEAIVDFGALKWTSLFTGKPNIFWFNPYIKTGLD